MSACLLGKPVRYDGGDKALESRILSAWQDEGRVVGLCPEIEGGLPVPRPAAEIMSGGDAEGVLNGVSQVFELGGDDVSPAFVAGARRALAVAREQGCRYALLTDGSPSCGSSFIYDGCFTGTVVAGIGVVTALLRRNGIEVFSPTEIADLAKRLEEIG